MHAPADVGLWITDAAMHRLTFMMDDEHLLSEVPLCGVWVGFESPLNVLGHTVHALHLQSLEGMARKTHLLISVAQGIPAHRIPTTPPRRIRDALLAEGVTYVSAYTVPCARNVFSTEIVCNTWKPVPSPPLHSASEKKLLNTAVAHGGRLSPEPDGGVELLVSLIRAALTVYVARGAGGIGISDTIVPLTHDAADHASITVLHT